MRRTLALWLLLFAAYAATLGLNALGVSEYGGDEPHYLLAAESIVQDGDVDVLDEYAARAYADFYPYELGRHGRTTEGRLNEPHGVGFPLLIAPAYAIGGAKGAELFRAALAAAALLALRLHERIVRVEGFVCFALLGALPWLGAKFVPAGVVIRAVAVRSLWRAQRRTLAVGAVELSLFSVALYVAFNEALYGGPTPYAADVPGETATDADFPGGYLERAYRLVALFIDRDYGLLRWAPVFVLAFGGLWWLWRSHRERLAQAVPGVRATLLAAALCAGAFGAQVLVAAFVAPTMFGFWFPPRHLLAALPLALPLVAMGLRHLPRLGSALALLTAAGSVWLYADVRWGDGSLVTGRPDAPFGPLTELFPLFQPGGGWPFWLAGAIGAGLLLLVLREARAARHSRQTAGATRARYSG